jgi:arylsulfatase A
MFQLNRSLVRLESLTDSVHGATMKSMGFVVIILHCLTAGVYAAERPNIVLIISDDQAWSDFGFMGHPHVETPHLDRLAEQSARYINGYTPSSVCRPSLATLLTGLYPHQHGIHFNHPPPGHAALSRMTEADYYRHRREGEKLIESVDTLPRVLAKHGYRSLQTGKHWEGHYRRAGFTHGMTLSKPSDEPAYGNKQLPDGSLVAHGNGDAGLNIGRTTMQPIDDFLDDHGDEPFLLWYAPFLPHEPHDAPERLLRLYEQKAGVPRHFRPYYAACTWFDETVGALIRSIESRGLAENTIFVFVIDNGWEPSTEPHRRFPGYAEDPRSKRSPFELGVRTPILIRWDGRVRPATHEAPCNTVDILPTLLYAVGLGEHAKDLPGVDLWPSATGREPPPKRPVFGEIYPGDATVLSDPSRDIAYRWIREGDWKLIVPHVREGRVWRNYVTRPALFHVADDPREQHDLSGDPQHARRIEQMRKALDAWWNPD